MDLSGSRQRKGKAKMAENTKKREDAVTTAPPSDRIKAVGQVCFYIGLCLEILIVILDKSSWMNPVEGQFFRVSFLFFACKVCCTKYSVKEWGAIIFAGVIAGICYLVSTRDEAVRVVVFCVSMKGVDYKKAMKVVLWGTLAGMAVLAALALAGVLGEVYDAGSAYGFKTEIPRLCLGVGNSNALACMLWALMTLGIYLYHKRLRLWHYACLLAFSVLVYMTTATRTAFLVMAATLFGAMLLHYVPKIRQAKAIYIAATLFVLAEVGFSVYAAHVSDWYEFMPEGAVKIDRVLTGRISSIYAFENGGGVLENWKLFGDPDFVEYFDMGYVRLFFWYGIIPGGLCIVMLCLLIWQCRRQQDYMGFVLTVSFAAYTLVEAHAVSVYIARNYVLLLMGAYWPCMLCAKAGQEEREAYWWRIYTLAGKRAG